jgi:hypothetical protein
LEGKGSQVVVQMAQFVLFIHAPRDIITMDFLATIMTFAEPVMRAAVSALLIG